MSKDIHEGRRKRSKDANSLFEIESGDHLALFFPERTSLRRIFLFSILTLQGLLLHFLSIRHLLLLCFYAGSSRGRRWWR